MNRSKAKFLTVVGICCCFLALTLSIRSVFETANFYFSPFLLFGGGIVLIVISLAYYTEK